MCVLIGFIPFEYVCVSDSFDLVESGLGVCPDVNSFRLTEKVNIIGIKVFPLDE